MLKVGYVSESLSVHDYRYLKKANNSDVKVFLFAIKEAVPPEILALPNIEVYHNELLVKYSKCRSRIMSYIYLFAVMRELKKWIKQIKPDVLHPGWVSGSGFITALAGFHPYLLMPWGSDILIFPKINARIRQMVKYAVRKADMIYCDCMDVKNDIVNSYGYPSEKITVFPFGIELDVFNPNRTEEAKKIRRSLGWENNKILVMNRTFAPEYNVECFLSALPAIFDAVPEARVFLMGSGPLESRFKQFVKDTAMQDKVNFTGFVSQTELADHLCASDIYVSTSLTDGTSLSLLEAMACRLPVVVTNVPANMEWIKDGVGGYVVPLGKAEMSAQNIELSRAGKLDVGSGASALLAKRLISLLEADTLRDAMAERNLAVAREKADWDKNFGKFVALYHELAAARKG